MNFHQRLVRTALSISYLMAAAPFVRAGLVEVNIFNNTVYEQTSSAAPTTADHFFFDMGGNFNAAGDFDSVSVAFPGPGSPVSPTITGKNFNFDSGSIATLAAVHTAFPFGTYTTTAENSMTSASQSGSLNYTADLFATVVPALTAATFTGLNGMNPAAPFTVSFNPFTPDASATEGFTFFTIHDPVTNAIVFDAGFLAPSTTSVVVPANTLAPNKLYDFELDFSNRLDGFDRADQVFTEQGFDVRTDGSFTTGPIVPEPTGLAIVATGLITIFVIQRRLVPVRKYSVV
jgi:hypothetical protein